jgi:hypothetical protein
VRVKNWKLYYQMTQSGAAGWLEPLTTFHFPMVANVKRDPFEQYVLPGEGKSLMSFGGALVPTTAYIYTGLGIMPIGQQMWEKELMSYKAYPPLQAPETFNLEMVLKQVQAAGHASD